MLPSMRDFFLTCRKKLDVRFYVRNKNVNFRISDVCFSVNIMFKLHKDPCKLPLLYANEVLMLCNSEREKIALCHFENCHICLQKS